MNRVLDWNNVIWQAIKSLKTLTGQENPHLSIDKLFSACEKELYILKAPERERELRLFALAFYCDRVYNCAFFKTTVFLRFSGALDLPHFERIAKMLIKENNFTLVVFWTIFRLSFGNYIPQSRCYMLLEEEMRNKSLELGTN